jgi:hypothetical protein
MQQKFLHGLLILSGVGLLLFLITKITKGSSLTGRVANVPDPVQKAFNKAFDNSPYQSLKDNWLAVSKMETAGWTSKLFNNSLNLWGMKKAKVRPNTQNGSTFGNTGRDTSLFQKLFPNVDQLQKFGLKEYFTTPLPPQGTVDYGQSEWAKYSDLNNAVADIILWMEYTKFPKGPLSLRDHIEQMKARKYFEEDTDYYLKAVQAWQAK